MDGYSLADQIIIGLIACVAFTYFFTGTFAFLIIIARFMGGFGG